LYTLRIFRLAVAATAVGLGLGLASPHASAQVITQYTFPGASLAPTTSAADVTAGNVSFAGSTASQFSFAGVLAVNAGAGAGNAATAVANNSYYQFAVAPLAGFQMDLNSLTFGAAFGSPGSGYVVRSSVDGFGSDLGSGVVPTGFPNLTPVLVDLTGASFQGLTSSTTFRLYTFLAGSAGNPALGYDNLTLNGTVLSAVPEPSPAALAGLGVVVAGGMSALRRRRRRGSPRS